MMEFRELKLLKEAGAVTIAQSRESCTVYGMPAEAVNGKCGNSCDVC